MGLGGDSSVDEYVFQLPESEKQKAQQELREDDSIRKQSLDQLREWIQKHPNIKKCRTGKFATNISVYDNSLSRINSAWSF